MKDQKLNKRRYLGKLCIHGHGYIYRAEDGLFVRPLGQSVRYKGCGTCCICNAISVEERKAQQEEYRNKPKNKKKMKKYQKNYRRAHKSRKCSFIIR